MSKRKSRNRKKNRENHKPSSATLKRGPSAKKSFASLSSSISNKSHSVSEDNISSTSPPPPSVTDASKARTEEQSAKKCRSPMEDITVELLNVSTGQPTTKLDVETRVTAGTSLLLEQTTPLVFSLDDTQFGSSVVQKDSSSPSSSSPAIITTTNATATITTESVPKFTHEIEQQSNELDNTNTQNNKNNQTQSGDENDDNSVDSESSSDSEDPSSHKKQKSTKSTKQQNNNFSAGTVPLLFASSNVVNESMFTRRSRAVSASYPSLAVNSLHQALNRSKLKS